MNNFKYEALNQSDPSIQSESSGRKLLKKRTSNLTKRTYIELGLIALIGLLGSMAVWFAVNQIAMKQVTGVSFDGSGTTFGQRMILQSITNYAVHLPTGPSIVYSNNQDGLEIESLKYSKTTFAAIDNPFDVAKDKSLIGFPFVAGAVAPIINFPNLPVTIDSPFSLSRNLLVSIFDGSVQHWSDPQIITLNPQYESYLRTANKSITVFHRTAPSGTNFIFTYALSSFSTSWNSTYGSGLRTNWPVGPHRVINNNDEMINFVSATDWSIGYAALSSVIKSNLPIEQKIQIANIQNKAGNSVPPSDGTIAAAMYDAVKKPHTGQWAFSLVDRSCATCWPISSFAYILLKTNYPKLYNSKDVVGALKFFKYAIENSAASQVGFLSPPESLQDRSLKTIASIQWNNMAVTLGNPTRWDWISAGIIAAVTVVTLVGRFTVAICVPPKVPGPKSRVTNDDFRDKSNTSLMEQILDADPAITQSPVRMEENLRRTFIDSQELHILEQIGKGAFGEVFTGTYNGAIVALKRILLPSSSDRNEVAETFVKEAGLMAALRHPNVVQFIGAAVSLPHLYMVTEYCAQGSLYDVIHHSTKPPPSPLTKIAMLIDAALGIMYLHAKGIVHRDIKTHNLLVDRTGTVKVADFGTSAALGQDILKSNMKTMCGTPEYVAPEVVSPKSKGYSFKADVFSFGVVMWEVWTGLPLYPGLEILDIIYGVTQGTLRPPISEVNNPDLAKLIDKCLQHDPEARPSFDEVLDVLKGVQATLEDSGR